MLGQLLARSLVVGTALCLAGSLGLPAVASTAPQLVDTPFALGGELFEPGTVQIQQIPSENVDAVVLNGRQIGLVFGHALDRAPGESLTGLVFRQDEAGHLHLVGIQWREPESGRHEVRLFRVAAVASGIGSAAGSPHEEREGSRRLLR